MAQQASRVDPTIPKNEGLFDDGVTRQSSRIGTEPVTS